MQEAVYAVPIFPPIFFKNFHLTDISASCIYSLIWYYYPHAEALMMIPKGRFSSSLIAIPTLFLITFIFSIASCKQQSPDGAKIENTPRVSDTTSGYLRMSDWENAKTFLKQFEEFIKTEMEGFFNASGLAIQYRDFGQYEQALEASRKIPSTIDPIEAAIARFKPVPNYPDTEELIKNLAAMPPHLRNYAAHLEQSLAAAVSGNTAKANALKEVYNNDHRTAMKYLQKAYDNFREILIRGSRTESQKIIGAKTGGPSVRADFKKNAQEIEKKYNEIIRLQIPTINRLTAAREYDKATAKSEDFYISVQLLMMELNKLEPGNEKQLWDAKQIITTALSYKLYAAQKQKEFIQNAKAGQAAKASAVKKELDVFNKMAEDEWAKLRKMRP